MHIVHYERHSGCNFQRRASGLTMVRMRGEEEPEEEEASRSIPTIRLKAIKFTKLCKLYAFLIEAATQ